MGPFTAENRAHPRARSSHRCTARSVVISGSPPPALHALTSKPKISPETLRTPRNCSWRTANYL